jgi:parallel beta-helix repeat protein
MNFPRLASAVCTLTLGLAGPGSAATFYVATTGNDAASGSSSAPWATLQHAVETIAPGDVILVRSGTYAGCRIRISGTQTQPKTLSRDIGATVVINTPGPQNSHSSLIEVESGSGTEVTDWIIDGFEVANSPHHGVDLRITNRITVRNCNVHHSAPSSSGTGIFLAFSTRPTIENNETAFNSEHGIYHSNSSDFPTIRGNRSHHNNGAGVHMNGDYSARCPCGTTVRDGIISFAVVENNIIYENGVGGGSAINMDGVDDSIVRNNLAYRNHASGISLFGIDGSHGSSRNKIYNNTIVMASDGRWTVNITAKGKNGPVGNVVKNNILYTERVDKGAIAVYSTAAGVLTSDYNVVVDRFSTNGGNSVTSTLAQWRAFGHDAHSFVSTASALFVDPTNNIYQLKTGSPAIDAGVNLSPDVIADINGLPRPQRPAYDIGCYEMP